MDQIILHHYPQSPISEKVRVALGIKGLQWHSVEVPRLPPKPDLVPLTGGYRRAPVMQIGADIYCDSQCILRELERRFPRPSLFPAGGEGLSWGLSRWTDGELFDIAVGIVLGAAADELPEAFARDRGRLYFGPNWDLKKLQRDLPHLAGQLRAHFGWLDEALESAGPYLAGPAPGLADALAYYLVWFVHGRWDRGPALIVEFPALSRWVGRIREIGHGEAEDMSAAEALAIAQAADPTTAEAVEPNDPLDLAPDTRISIVPDVDAGDPEVEGRLRLLERDRVAILRNDVRVGTVAVHFPRAGYRITVL